MAKKKRTARRRRKKASDFLRADVRAYVDLFRVPSYRAIASPLEVPVASDEVFVLPLDVRAELTHIVEEAQRLGKLPTPLEHCEGGSVPQARLLQDGFLQIEAALRHYLGLRRQMADQPIARNRAYAWKLAECLRRFHMEIVTLQSLIGESGELVPPLITASITRDNRVHQFFFTPEEIAALKRDPWGFESWPAGTPPLKELRLWLISLRLRVEPILYILERPGRPRGTALDAFLCRLAGIWVGYFGKGEYWPTVSARRGGGNGGPFLMFVETALKALPEAERPAAGRRLRVNSQKPGGESAILNVGGWRRFSTISSSKEPVMETQRLLSVREFGRAYGVGRTRIYELLNEGSIEGRKFGARTLITAESAESWAASLPKFEPRQGATISAGARQ